MVPRHAKAGWATLVLVLADGAGKRKTLRRRLRIPPRLAHAG
jgi:hypothetical protein